MIFLVVPDLIVYLQTDVEQPGGDCCESANDQEDGEDLQVRFLPLFYEEHLTINSCSEVASEL